MRSHPLTKKRFATDACWEREISFLWWSVTECISLTPGQTPRPGVVGKNEHDFFVLFLHVDFTSFHFVLFCLGIFCLIGLLLVSYDFHFVSFVFFVFFLEKD